VDDDADNALPPRDRSFAVGAHRRLPVAASSLVVALLLAGGCDRGDLGPRRLSRRVDAAASARSEAACTCQAMTEGGDADGTPEERLAACLAADRGSPSARRCESDARAARLERGGVELAEGLACRADADEADAACLRAAAETGCRQDDVADCASRRSSAVARCPPLPVADVRAIERDVYRCLGAPGCPAVDLGAEPSVDWRGTTEGRPDDFDAVCGGTGGSEVTFRWTAPDDRTVSISTDGSSIDTVLSIYRSCTDPEPLVCDDDDLGLNPEIRLPVDAGDTFVLVVDGFDETQAGDVVLRLAKHVREPEEEEGDGSGDGGEGEGER